MQSAGGLSGSIGVDDRMPMRGSMRPEGPSVTAWSAAAHRAAHQLLEDGRIFDDPFAVAIVGGVEADILAHAEADATRGPMRIFIAVRHRVAEDEVDDAYARGEIGRAHV